MLDRSRWCPVGIHVPKLEALLAVVTLAGGAASDDPPELMWEQTFGTTGNFYHLLPLPGDRFAVSGYYNTATENRSGVFCLDTSGDMVWTWLTGGASGSIARFSTRLADGRLVVAGGLVPMPGLNLRAMIAILSSDGQELARFLYDLDEASTFVCVLPLPDGGFAAGGTTSLSNMSIPILMRVDQDGNTLWMRYYEGSSGTVRHLLMTDSGDLLAMVTPESGAPRLVCYDLDGQFVWLADFSGVMGGGEGCICHGTSTEYVICSSVNAAGLDGSAGIEWLAEPWGYHTRTLKSVRTTMDGGLIMAGAHNQYEYWEPYMYHPYDGWLVRTDDSGNSLWCFDLYKEDADTYFYGAGQLEHGGYAACGRTEYTPIVVCLAPELGIGEAPREAAASAAPNPFDSSVTLGIATPGQGPVEVSVFDLTGRLVDRLASFEAGPCGGTAVWAPDASIPDGLYVMRIKADGEELSIPVMRLSR
jgi:hypothetical protein